MTSAADPTLGSLRVDPEQPSVLRVSGEADIETVTRFCAEVGVDEVALGRYLARVGVREIDLSAATFIDSAMIATIVGIVPPIRPERLRVVGATGSPLATLRLTGVDALLDLV